jgi:hypothetical protein
MNPKEILHRLRLGLSLVMDCPLDVDMDSCELQGFRDA